MSFGNQNLQEALYDFVQFRSSSSLSGRHDLIVLFIYDTRLGTLSLVISFGTPSIHKNICISGLPLF